MESILNVAALCKDYPGAEQAVRALDGVSFTVRPGEFVVIMGPSGSGKSTLLHLIGGLDRPSSGSLMIEGRDLAQMNDHQRTVFRRRRLGIVFQAYNLLPGLSALENVSLPAVLDGRNGRAVEQRAGELLRQVDLSHRARHRPDALSGGEQQRVAIARALMNEPVLLLADEPTGNLDTQHGEAVWRLLGQLSRQTGRTIVAVTHEANGAAFADRVLVLKDGRIAGQIEPQGETHATAVAARYAELVA